MASIQTVFYIKSISVIIAGHPVRYSVGSQEELSLTLSGNILIEQGRNGVGSLDRKTEEHPSQRVLVIISLTNPRSPDGRTAGTANEKAMRQDEYYHWSRVDGLNGYEEYSGWVGTWLSITSELFAPSSTTNLMNMTIKTIEESEELSKILKSPIKFHTSPTPSGSKRTSGIPQSFQHQNGVVELRFWSSHSRSQDLDPSESHSTQSSWWPGLLKSIMPNTLGRSSSSSNDSRSWSERFFSNHGSFEHGEVVAELIKESDGKWKYKSLVIDFPDSQTSKYRLKCSQRIKKIKTSNRRLMGDETEDLGEPKQTATRYRFWNRKINL
ncbi:hypothetical protein PSHT_03248 [Puccinia striiformis]|uniref:Mitochondrial import inner membrane translocase subunit Tim21 n=1 Tax=Puccinia striiformis TaxID=27350 RepID=A0A2S4WFT4_9BASI|nr:hypothetical protein PSHT_03248 [Puccinia striiformis]